MASPTDTRISASDLKHMFDLLQKFETLEPLQRAIGRLGELTIVLKPAFALERKGTITAYVPWMFKDERLTSNIAGIGVHLLELGLQTGAYQDWRFALFDTVTKKAFTRTHKNTAEAAHFLIRSQEEQLVAQKSKKVA